jgi:hypothetical protein
MIKDLVNYTELVSNSVEMGICFIHYTLQDHASKVYYLA